MNQSKLPQKSLTIELADKDAEKLKERRHV